MPRIARVYTEEGIFHILTRGNNKQWIFREQKDFQEYENILKQLKQEQPFKLYHYCLMNNHVHLIIETNQSTKLSKLMKRINLLYYNHYKRIYGYTGHFWQDRFKSLLIEKNNYLLACGLYIERNPVRAKIVSSAEKYLHSSYSYYAYGRDDGLIDRDVFYNELGKEENTRQKEYQRLMLDGDPCISINSSIFNQLFLGTPNFIKQMEKKFKVKNIRLKRGRPSKKK
jgi:putative transposase